LDDLVKNATILLKIIEESNKMLEKQAKALEQASKQPAQAPAASQPQQKPAKTILNTKKTEIKKIKKGVDVLYKSHKSIFENISAIIVFMKKNTKKDMNEMDSLTLYDDKYELPDADNDEFGDIKVA
jgi:hypothetical protein